MPVRLPLSVFNQIVRTTKPVRATDDWRITVQPDSFYLETRSEDGSILIHHVLPASLFIEYQIDDVSSPSWINIDPRNTSRSRLFPHAASDDVTLTLPSEREDTRLALQSGNRTFRFGSIKSSFHFTEFTGDQIATVSLRSGLVNRAVQAVDLVSDSMRISVEPDASQIEFSGQNETELCSYIPPLEKTDIVDSRPTDIKISLGTLTEILNKIPDSATVSLIFAQNYLKIDITGHVSEGKMSIYLANIRDTD